MESKFGWLLSGPAQKESNRENDLNTLCQRIEIMPAEESQLHNLLTKVWEISKLPEENDKNDDIIIKFQKTIQFKKATGRYNVRLPWKLKKHDLPTNFILSKRGLNSLLNSLNKKEPGPLKKYNEQILKQVNFGFTEKVRNLNLHEGILHYIPPLPCF